MSEFNFGLLFILGISVFGGIIGAWFSQKMRIPQVVGYIVIGLIIGESGLQLVRMETIENLRPLNLFALGIIGFLVGGELKIESFKKYARQFMAILIGEGVGAFLLVGIPSYFIIDHIIHQPAVSLAASIVFGAIASATDPASTIDVLWEYRCKGVLTTSVTAIVALDDALAMTLYGLGTSTAQLLTSGSVSYVNVFMNIAIELGGAVLLGVVFAYLLGFLLKWLYQPEKSLPISIGLILLLISISVNVGMDVILAAMTLGFVLTNALPRRSEGLFKTMRGFSTPIYVLFFVMVGARLGLGDMPTWLFVIVGVYVVGRSAGKMLGAYWGAKATGSEPVIRKYMGFGLFAQGGVAVGLSIMASHHLSDIPIADGMFLGDAIIFSITATTLIVQLIGPSLVKFAVKKAGETGKNITEEDVLEKLKVSDVMEKDLIELTEGEPLQEVIRKFVKNEYFVYPVVNGENRLLGTVSLKTLKDLLTDQDTWNWLVANDVMEHTPDIATPNDSLKEVLHRMLQLKIEQMPVVNDMKSENVVGMIDVTKIRKHVNDMMLVNQA